MLARHHSDREINEEPQDLRALIAARPVMPLLCVHLISFHHKALRGIHLERPK